MALKLLLTGDAIYIQTGIIKISNQEKQTLEQSHETSNSTINLKSITVMKKIFTETEKREESQEDEYFGSMIGRITDLNVWNSSFSEEDMAEWLQCKNVSHGNVVAWETSQWTLENVTESEMAITDICQNERLFMFPPETALDSGEICKQLGGHLFSSSSNESVWEALRYKFQNKKICKLYLGTTIQLDSDTNVLINKITGNEIETLNWENGHPYNRVGYNCVSINKMGKYVSMSCDTIVCPVCEFANNPRIILRGTCEKGTKIDVAYSIDNTESQGKFYELKGSFRTKIYFDSGSWIIQDFIEERLIAFQNGSLSYPFGTFEWTFYNGDCTEPGENWKYLSLSICNDDHFPCGDGQCVLNALRCDNKLDCSDGTDEENCKILQIPKSYAKDIPPASNLTVGINIIEIVDVSEAFNTITIRFRLFLTWRDARLKYRNLRQTSAMNVVPEDEALLQWMPEIHFPNLVSDVKSEDIGIVYITKMLDDFQKVKEGVTANEVFKGSDHTMTNEKQLSMKFTCFYKLWSYPFDTQRCKIGLAIEGIASLSMRKFICFNINLFFLKTLHT